MLLGTIFHEHLCHHSVKPMMKFLKKHGMELIDIERVQIQKGSLIGTVQPDRRQTPGDADRGRDGGSRKRTASWISRKPCGRFRRGSRSSKRKPRL